MTFTEIVDEIRDRLSLTSPDASERVGRLVNWSYRRLLGSVGMSDSTRQEVSQSVAFGVESRTFTFDNVLKLYRVWHYAGGESTPTYVDHVSIDEIREDTQVELSLPRRYAVFSQTATSITILVDVSIVGSVVLHADAQVRTPLLLAGNDVPNFDENYHNVLVESVLKDEYRKEEKVELASMSQRDYERGVSELRLFIAKNNYLTFQQGRNRHSRYRSRSAI